MYFSLLLLPVDDASGHYTTGIFYGNNYWIGSLSLCNSIYKANYKRLESPGKCSPQNEEILQYRFFNLKLLPNFAVRTSHTGKEDISFNDLYNPTLSTPHENPPFVPGFFILKVMINETEIVKNVC